MIRLALWLVSSLVIAGLIAWITGLPGTILIEVGGWRAEPQLGVAMLAGLVLAVLAGFAMWLVIMLLATPGRLSRRRRMRRQQLGIEALSDGFIALAAGDAGRARALARDAQSRLPSNSAARLLEARAELALGNMPAAREQYRALIADEKTALAALTGLYEQAQTQRRPTAALTFARKALALSPSTSWASDAVFDDLVRRREWAQAVAMINDKPAPTRETRAKKRRIQAVIETARAREAETTDPLNALEHALTALRLLPDFVPAALIAARIQSSQGDVRRAQSLLRRIWRATAHPHIAALYAYSQPGASPGDRLKRLRDLVPLPPESRAGAMALARAAIDAEEFSLGRLALKDHLDEPTSGIASLMAEIEDGEGDQGKARAWLSRAVQAPRDPAWTADGIIADEWEPVSPVTGRLDAFAWKVPVSAAATVTTTEARSANADARDDVREPSEDDDMEPENPPSIPHRNAAPLPLAAAPMPL
jgi:HemY protein